MSENLSTISEFLPTIIDSLTLLIVALTLVVHSRRNLRFHRVEEARMYFELTDRWAKILELLYELRTKSAPTKEELEARYPAYADFMATAEWRGTYRPICNFFEDVGLLVKRKVIDINVVRVLVTVDPKDYELLRGVLEYLRQHYTDRWDIYIFWNYLLELAAKEDPLRPYAENNVYEPPD